MTKAYVETRKDSDIDLIIVNHKFKGKKSFKRSIEFYKYWDLDYPVDFLCYTPEEFNRLKKEIIERIRFTEQPN